MNFPHPFHRRDSSWQWGRHISPNEQLPRAAIESVMIEASWSIRQKPSWETKMKDRNILRKWKQELEEQNTKAVKERQLTERMIYWVFRELKYYADLIDPDTGIQHACDDVVFWSDRLIPEDLKNDLCTEVEKLENVPDDEKDWHPGSNGQVLDLVHPSLYPIVYGRTQAQDRVDQKFKVLEFNPSSLLREDLGETYDEPTSKLFWSTKFCWLPSDFDIDPQGKATLVSPYINNIHPSNRSLVNVIERLVSAFVPMWERVLGAIAVGPRYTGRVAHGSCLWRDGKDDSVLRVGGHRSDYMDWPGEHREERRMNWLRSRDDMILPEAHPGFKPVVEESFDPIDLKSSPLQVIVKIANIHLTPANPEYPGGNWHVEGMMNEKIVSTGIYYYDSQNITDSHLAFRVYVDAPHTHGQDHNLCLDWTYNLLRDGDLVQSRGQFHTKAGACLAFPNIYQHRVSSFRLEDPTKPGHRKIVALFLVDPTHYISSASHVPLQQKKWASDPHSTRDTQAEASPRLPPRPKDSLEQALDPLMTQDEAEKYRLELMNERSQFVVEYNGSMTVPFNFCEH